MPINKAGRRRTAVRFVFMFSACIIISSNLCQIMTIIYTCQDLTKNKKATILGHRIVASLKTRVCERPLSAERDNDFDANTDTNIENGDNAVYRDNFFVRIFYFH